MRTEKGYIFTHGRTEIFLITDAQRKTDNIARAIIDAVAAARNTPAEVIERAKADAATLADFKRRTDAATLEAKTTPNGTRFFTISGKNFSFNYPESDFYNDVIVMKGGDRVCFIG